MEAADILATAAAGTKTAMAAAVAMTTTTTVTAGWAGWATAATVVALSAAPELSADGGGEAAAVARYARADQMWLPVCCVLPM